MLSTIVANAVQLSGTEAGAIYVFDDQQRQFYLRATYGMDQDLINALAQQHIGLNDSNAALALAQREPTQIADLKDQPPSAVNEIILCAGFRALLVAPLLRGEGIVGLLVVRRRTPGAFAQNTVDLIKTFAAQSAVAIENARLFKNVETSLEDLRNTQDRLVQTQKLASLGQLTAGIAHEIKNPLNFVNNFSEVSAELISELQEALAGVKIDSKRRGEIVELTDTLRNNLDKIVQHGKRADSIVKNMLLHSREGSGEHRLVDTNALVEEGLNLAYHGARAEKQGFNINIERSFDPAAGKIDVFPQEITRALLNLILNGFYAATKPKAQANKGSYEPTLTAATRNLGDRVEIRIRDNGTGIPPEVKEKMFNPFFTTKPAGEGTGLGLSISHDIIVKQHSGSIEVELATRRVHRGPHCPAASRRVPYQVRRTHVNPLVLVVDDEPDVEVLFRQQFPRDLRAGRFTMEFAPSAPMALQRIIDAAGVSLILILADINMPGMSGLELLPKAKALRPDVPVIMITAYGDAETKRLALESGAEALLTKPINFGTLRSEIDMRVERAP